MLITRNRQLTWQMYLCPSKAGARQTPREQARCATSARRHRQAWRDARGMPQRVKCAWALPTATTALPSGTNPKRRAAARGTQQHNALAGLVGLKITLCCCRAGLVPCCRTEFESTVPPFFSTITASLLGCWFLLFTLWKRQHGTPC